MRRVAFACIIALLAVAGPGAARTLVEVGPLTAEADMNRNEDCTVGLDPELCAASVDTNDTAAPGDDEIWHDKRIDEVALYLRVSPASEPQNVSIQPDELVVHHPVFTTANESWQSLDAMLPPAVHDHLSFDSTGMADKPGDEYDDSTWGLSLHAYPLGVDTPRLWVVCWDLSCERIWWGTFESKEDGIYFESVLGGSSPWDSDAWLDEFILQGVLACSSVWRDVGCPESTLAQLRDATSPSLELVKNETPQAHTFHHVNGTSVHVGEDSPDLVRSAGSGAATLGSRTPAMPPTTLRKQPPAPPPGEGRPAPAPVQSVAPGSPTPSSDRPHRLAIAASVVPERSPSMMVLTAVAGGLILALLLAAFYTRLSRDRVLNHEKRRLVYDAICAEPGVRVGTIATRLGLDHTTVRHHVAILRDFNLVKTSGNANNRLLPVGRLSSAQEELCSRVLANPTAKTVYEFLQTRGPRDLQSLAQALGLAYSTVSAATVHLRKAGLVQRERQWGRWMLKAKAVEERHRAEAARPLTTGAS